MSILATKLHVVRPQSKLVQRSTLQESLDEIPHRRLTIISAPAGFGKTTTVGRWIAEHDFPVAWVSLDPEDNSPGRFLEYLVAALRTIHPAIDGGLLNLPTPVPPLSALLPSLIHELSAITHDYLLVLDDYHVMTESSIHDAIAFLLEHGPPSLHIVLTTRSDPPFPLARLRVRGDLVELRAADLRFSSTEIASFFNEVMRLDLNADQLRLLAEKTEGWAAGLQMAAISLRGRDDVASFLEGFSGADRFVLDYLIEEVLGRLDSRFQEALMALSVVDRFNARLFEALVTGGSGVDLLAELERNNLFLIPLDNHREWYRFHHLFADLLRHRLNALYPGRLTELHCRAAAWYEDESMIEIALTHARASGNAESLAGLIDRHWRRLIANVSVEGLYEDARSMPESIKTDRLAIVEGWGMLHLNMTEGVADLMQEVIEKDADDVADDVNDVRGHAEVILALASRNRADTEGIIRHGERALTLIPDRRPGDPHYVWLVSHGILRSLIGDAWHALGDIEPALEAFEKAIAIGRAANDLRTVQVGGVNRGRELLLAGRLREALTQLNDNDAMVASSQGFLSDLAHQRQWYGRALLLRGALDQALEQIEAALVIDRGRIGYRVEGYRLRSLIALLAGDRGGVEEYLRRLDGVPTIGGQERFSLIGPALRADIAFFDDDIVGIERWTTFFAPGGQADRVQRRAFNATQRELAIHGRGLVRLGREEEGLAILQKVDQEYARRGNVADRLQATLGIVNALERLGRIDEAEKQLEETMALVADERILFPFAMARHEIRKTLDRLDRRRTTLDVRITPSFMIEVLNITGMMEKEGAVASTPPTPASEAPQLTSRESEILALMAMGLSNQKIADRLYLSVNTIKTHASNLFDKLGATSRVEALVKAKEMGVIE